MSALHAHQEVIPRPVAWMAGILVALSLLGAGAARLTGYSATTLPDVPLLGEAAIALHVRSDDILEVRREDALLLSYGPGEGGFLRGLHRAMGRTRIQAGVALDAPFQLQRWGDGRFSLADPHTGSHIELNAFGQDNVTLFKEVWLAAQGAGPGPADRSWQ